MYISRLVEAKVVETLKNRKVLFLLGARQVGKTTLIEHLLAHCSGSLLNMDMATDRSRLVAAGKLEPAEAVRSLGGADVLVIDEAQRIPDIGRITKGWYDAHVSSKIILLGSSSATLLDMAAAELTGRNEKLWLTPFLFQEILSQQKWFSLERSSQHLQEYFADQIRSLLLGRLVFGSYPEAYLSHEPAEYLTNLSSDYLLKDIFTSSLVRSPEDVRRLLLELAAEVGNTVSVAQLATRLKLSRQTISRYLDLLEAIFVIFSVPAYYTDPIKEISKSRKYYFWDTGIKNALQQEWTVSEDRSGIDMLWQNWVMAEIFKQGKTFGRHEELCFWESRNGSKVDLVVKQGTAIHPFQISFYPDEAKSSQAFISTYGQEVRTIHPENILDVLM